MWLHIKLPEDILRNTDAWVPLQRLTDLWCGLSVRDWSVSPGNSQMCSQGCKPLPSLEIWFHWFPTGSAEKKPLANAGDACSILYCSCLGNPMDRGDWRAAVHEATRSRTPLSNKATQHIFHSQGEAVVPQGEVPAFKVMSSVWEFFVLFCFFNLSPFPLNLMFWKSPSTKQTPFKTILFVFLFLNQSNHIQLSAGLPDQLTIGVATLSWHELQKSPEQSSHSHTFHGQICDFLWTFRNVENNSLVSSCFVGGARSESSDCMMRECFRMAVWGAFRGRRNSCLLPLQQSSSQFCSLIICIIFCLPFP